MPITPEEFAAQYLPITFTSCEADQGQTMRDGASLQVHIRKYLNANFRYKKDPKTKKVVRLPYEANKGMPYTEMKDAFMGFIMDRAGKNRDGLHLLAGKTILCFDTTPEISLSFYTFQNAFDGKTTPTHLRDVLRLYTYWHSADPEPRKRWATPQAFADQCLGLDCNGYTGSYFFTQYTYLGIEPNTAIEAYDTQKAKKRRKGLAEIEERDVLVFPGYGHIALVGRIVSRSDSGVTCNVCQSTGTMLNGLQVTQGSITHANGAFGLSGTPLKSIVKVIG